MRGRPTSLRAELSRLPNTLSPPFTRPPSCRAASSTAGVRSRDAISGANVSVGGGGATKASPALPISRHAAAAVPAQLLSSFFYRRPRRTRPSKVPAALVLGGLLIYVLYPTPAGRQPHLAADGSAAVYADDGDPSGGKDGEKGTQQPASTWSSWASALANVDVDITARLADLVPGSLIPACIVVAGIVASSTRPAWQRRSG